MKLGYKTFLIIIAGLCSSIIMPAQEIQAGEDSLRVEAHAADTTAEQAPPQPQMPSAPADKSVSTGVLPNGMTYFVAENKDEKGLADFALVRKDIRDSAHGPEYNVHHIRNIMISASEAAMDSTLLSIMLLAEEGLPTAQAVAVSGDIDTAAVSEKIKMLSYMIPAGDTLAAEPYQWKESGRATHLRPYLGRRLATVNAVWSMARTPREYMATLQPAVSSFFIGQLGIIACGRLAESLEREGIPAVGIEYVHNDSADGWGDESLALTMSVDPSHLYEAVEILGDVTASLDQGTATVQEIERAAAAYLESMRSSALPAFSDNASYIDRFVSAFLYGGTLAAPSEIFTFLSSRALDEDMKISFFNGIASALLDKDSNLVLEVISSDEADEASVNEAFLSGWDGERRYMAQDRVRAEDVLPSLVPDVKTKMKPARKEPVSGGTVMIFANGLKVVSKDVADDARVFFSLSLNGGYSDIPGLKAGEGPLVQEYLESNAVAGVSGKDFRAALRQKGIYLDFEVTESETAISGYGSKFDLPSIVDALALVAGSRSHDAEAFGYALSCVPLKNEALKGTFYDRMNAVNSIMCPGSEISVAGAAEKVSDDFVAKAEAFLARQFGRTDDGVLVFAGDVNEEDLRKTLVNRAHLFRTARSSQQHRKNHYRTISGVSTYMIDGEVASVDVAMSADVPVAVDRHIASEIAVGIIAQEAEKAFENTGWKAEVRYGFGIYPDERLNVVVTLTETDPTFVPSPEPIAVIDAVNLLRSTLSSVMQMTEIPQKRMDAFRFFLKSSHELNSGNPGFLIEVVKGRFLYGKDMMSGYQEKVDAVTPEDVLEIFSLLDASGKVEYIIINEN